MKTIKSIIAVAIALPLAACGGKGEQSNDNEAGNSENCKTENITNNESNNLLQIEDEVCETSRYDFGYLSPTAYGPFILNENIDAIEAEMIEPVYYNKTFYEYNPHNDLKLKGYYTYYFKGDRFAIITVDQNDKIIKINVHGPNIKTDDDIKMGDPISKLISDPRVSVENGSKYKTDNYHYFCNFHTGDINDEIVTDIFIGWNF